MDPEPVWRILFARVLFAIFFIFYVFIGSCNYYKINRDYFAQEMEAKINAGNSHPIETPPIDPNPSIINEPIIIPPNESNGTNIVNQSESGSSIVINNPPINVPNDSIDAVTTRPTVNPTEPVIPPPGTERRAIVGDIEDVFSKEYIEDYADIAVDILKEDLIYNLKKVKCSISNDDLQRLSNDVKERIINIKDEQEYKFEFYGNKYQQFKGLYQIYMTNDNDIDIRVNINYYFDMIYIKDIKNDDHIYIDS